MEMEDFYITHKKKGFSLVELIVVMIIVGIVVAIAAPIMQSLQISAKLTESYIVVAAIAKALQVYYLEKGEYPDQFNGSYPPGNVWSYPLDPDYVINKWFRDTLEVELYPNAKSEFRYATPYGDGAIFVSRDGTEESLYKYQTSDKSWHEYNLKTDSNGWKKYLTIKLLPE